MAYSEKIEKLIRTAMVDGQLDEIEEKVLRKAAEAEGVDPDELIMFVKAKLVSSSLEKESGDLLSKVERAISVSKKIGCVGWIVIFVILSFILCIIYDNINNNINNKTTINGKEYTVEDFNQVLSDNDFELAHALYDRFHRRNWLEPLLTKEVQYLAADGSVDAINKIAYLLNSVDLGVKIEEGLAYSSYDTHKKLEKSTYPENVRLINSVCDKVLDLAIAGKNINLAEKILSLYKNTIKVTEGSSKSKVVVNGTVVEEYHAYVEYVDTDYKAAKARFDKAKKEGAFK